MQLVMAALVYPDKGEASKFQKVELSKLANTLHQRKRDGHADSVLLMGIDFPHVEALRELVVDLGLPEVDFVAITVGEQAALGDAVEPVLRAWLQGNHPAAVCYLGWTGLLEGLAVPHLNWRWTGVKVKPVVELSALHEAMEELVPQDFKPQVSTWLGLLLKNSTRDFFDSEDVNYDISMDALGLARWLEAYDQVSENGFFGFDYTHAADLIRVDQMRLGQEVWQQCPEETAEVFEDVDATQADLCGLCLKICLSNRATNLASTLRDSFGDTSALLWALQSTIWPCLSESSEDAASDFLAGNRMPLSELRPLWDFVNNGWGKFSED